MRRARVIILLTMVLAALPFGVAMAQYPAPLGVCTVALASQTVAANSVATYNITVKDSNDQPVAGVSGTATIASQPGTGASVLTPTFTTNAQGKATVQVQTGSAGGALQVAFTCGNLSASSVVSVSAPSVANDVPKPPDTGNGGSSDGKSFPLLWVLLGVAGLAATGVAATAVSRKR